MKRSPLNRKTPLKRGDSKLDRSTRIKPRSKKTQKLYEEKRIPLVIKVLNERPTCERCKVQPSTDVHEILTRGRSGGVHGDAWLDESNVLALCRPCHTWITDNPKEAKKQGYIRDSEV